MLEVIPIRRHDQAHGLPAPAKITGIDLYGALLADAANPHTHRVRVQDVADLAGYIGTNEPRAACNLLTGGTAGQGNAVAMGYKRDMIARKLSASTVNRRLSTLRRVVKLARRLGLVDWLIDVDSMRTKAYRDTAGPGNAGWRKLLATGAAAGDGPKARRDRALLRLLHDNGLRRGEVVALDLADVDLPGARVAVVGKGSTERCWLTINAPTAQSLEAWISARGSGPGPLFVNFAVAGPSQGGRLTGDGVHKIVRELGRRARLGRAVRPHGLRHEAITRLLDLTDQRIAQKFSRHKDLNTLGNYDDNKEDLAGRAANLRGADC